MTEKPLHRCWTKATDREPGLPRYSFNWVVSRREWLRLFADRLECGDWVIPARSVTAATMYTGGLGQILVVATPDRTYQFGLNPWCRVEKHLPFQVTRDRLKLCIRGSASCCEWSSLGTSSTYSSNGCVLPNQRLELAGAVK